jgi:hypothetical protein
MRTALACAGLVLTAPGVAAAAVVVSPAPGPAGWHRGPVDVRVEGADQYRLDGGPWTPLVAGRPVRIAGDGTHTLEYRSGEAEPRSAFVRIDGTAPELSLARGGRVALRATAADALSGAQRIEMRVGAGRWRSRPLAEVLFDGSAASFRRWRQGGSGSFELTRAGNLRTVGGLGLLWYAEREFGNAALHLQWREARTDSVPSNAGVFVRFPGAMPVRECDLRMPMAVNDFAWHAVACGHEIQINDGDVDPQRTGSVYAFRPLGADGSRPAPFGAWNDYEVRTTGAGDYEITVARNGELINRFVNTPGQSPASGGASGLYPGTEYKQFATGFVGLQNHGDADTIEFRDVRILPLEPRTATLSVRRTRRTRTLRVRAVDAAGNRSRIATRRVRGAGASRARPRRWPGCGSGRCGAVAASASRR